MTRSTQPRRSRGRTVKPNYTKRIIGGIAALAALILLGVFMYNRLTPGLNGPIANLQTFSNLEQGHQDGVLTYAQTPPAGGIHNPRWQNCGIYAQPIPTENAVHSMEHGAAWIAYRPDLAPDQVEMLRSIVRGRLFTLLAPYPNLPGTIVASAWGFQVQVDRADDVRLKQFLAQFERGPETPELGAPCTGGIGLPVEK